MLKTLTIAAITLISAATLAPAHAWIVTNGGGENGIGLNGIGLNGVGLNGVGPNGIGLNGVGPNGIGLNGQGDNGVSLNGHSPTVTLLGIALPDGHSVAR